MTEEVKLQTPKSHWARGLLQSTNIPFLHTTCPDDYKTSHQADFQPLSAQRTELCLPRPSQIQFRDPGYINDFLTETAKSFKPHQLPPIIRIPNWTKFTTNFRLETGPQDGDMYITVSQQMKPHPVQPRQACIRPSNSNLFQQKGKLPGSITQTTFIQHHVSPLVKAKGPKDAGIFPPLEEHGRCVISVYRDHFQEHCGYRAPQIIKPSTSLRISDTTKNMEQKTSYSVSFVQPSICSHPQKVKQHTNVKLGGFHDDACSSTSREDFCYPKLEDPVVRVKRNPSVSAVLKGDTDEIRNKERMSTTHQLFFSNLKGAHQTVSLPAADLITRSHVQISHRDPSGFSYKAVTCLSVTDGLNTSAA